MVFFGRDHPGAKQAIFKRGVKYADQIQDSTKSAVSVMMCGSASGVLLPPYTVYKAKHTYESWTVGGPKGAIYNSTKSGWFDMFVFNDWFHKTFLPHVRKLPGKKLLLGDNLASHISMGVIKSCRENAIEFVCLPPNSTHILQPLDVGFFSSMKAMWRKLLSTYAMKNPAAKLLDKPTFPTMLKVALKS